MNTVVTIIVLITSGVPTTHSSKSKADLYYKLWTSQMNSVQLELGILREKVLEGEEQLAAMKSECAEMASISSAVVMNNPKRGLIEKKNSHGLSQTPSLLNAFANEKLFVRQLRERFDVWNQSLVLMSARLTECQQQSENTAVKLDQTAQSISGTLDEKIQQLSSEFEKKVEGLQNEVMRLSNMVSNELAPTLDTLQQSRHNIDHRLDEHSRSISTLERERCQSGEFGAARYPHSPFPQTFTITFNPTFTKKPEFVYGYRWLDIVGGVRVQASLYALTKDKARIHINTWANTGLFGARIVWMACPAA